MSSTIYKPAGSTGGRHAEGRGLGLVMFASILLVVISFFNMIYGIAAIANSHVFTANAHYVIGDLRAWGWITLILAVLQLIAAGGILAGNQLARWFAVAVVGLNAIDMMFFIPAYPFWALTIIAVDVVALWGLCAYGSRQNLDAVRRRLALTGRGWKPAAAGQRLVVDGRALRDHRTDVASRLDGANVACRGTRLELFVVLYRSCLCR